MRKLIQSCASACFLLAFGPLAQADMILFSGNTQSSTFSNWTQTYNSYLSFTASSFSNLGISVGAAPTALDDLGIFTLSFCDARNCTEQFSGQGALTDFTLRLLFSAPTVTHTPELFGADIYGSIAHHGSSNNYGGSVAIDFDNALQHLSYVTASGSGVFDLLISDSPSLTADSPNSKVRGSISNLTFVPNPRIESVASVPEPASLVLLATAVTTTGWSLRRRRRLGRRNAIVGAPLGDDASNTRPHKNICNFARG